MSNETVQTSKDSLGDRLKQQEQVEAGRRANHGIPLMARLDGRAFHTFTRGLPRPYDVRLSTLMIDTARFLVEETHARLGYTQSDEISLVWWNDDPEAESSYLFDGKIQKMTSVLAGMASAYFTRCLPERIPEKANMLATFDCRVWNVPSKHEAFLNFLWRQDDAIKNSISMAAQAHFSHKRLHAVDSEAKKQLLRELGKPWENEPTFFKSGTFVRRELQLKPMTAEQLEKIPEKYRPTGPIMRSSVVNMDLGYIKNDARARSLFE